MSKSGRIGIGAVENVIEEDGERNLRISVYDEGRLLTFSELLEIVVVRSLSG